MRLATAQVAPAGDLQANLDRTRALVREAVSQGAGLVVFPELHLSGYRPEGHDGSDVIAATDPRLISAAGGTPGVGVLLCFAEDIDQVTYNSAAYCAAGHVRYVHRKLILPSYPPFSEDQHFREGDHLRTFETPLGRAAVLLCEDAVQPAFPAIVVQDGAELLLVPASSAHSLLPEVSNREHWHAITNFYARVAQCHVVFANRVGQEGPFRFWGGSHVRDPQGRIVAQAPEEEESLLLVDIDRTAVDCQRRRIPFLRNPRLDVVARELRRLTAGL